MTGGVGELGWGLGQEVRVHQLLETRALPLCPQVTGIRVRQCDLPRVAFPANSLVLCRKKTESGCVPTTTGPPALPAGGRLSGKSLLDEFDRTVPANVSIPSGFSSTNNLRQVLELGEKRIICVT